MDLEVLPNGNRKLVLRQSAFKTAMTCGREFYLTYVRNLEPKQEKYSVAEVGTLVHAGLQAHYSELDFIPAIAKATNEAIEKNPLIAAELQAAAVLAQIMVTGYIEWLEENGKDQGLTPLLIEKRLEAYIGTFNGVEVYINGAIDLLLKDHLGQIWVYDHKTVQTFGDVEMLGIDFQGQTYDMLVRSNYSGYLPTGFIHNQLRRVKRTGTAKPPFYNREIVHFNDAQRETHMLHLQGIAARMVDGIIAVEADEQRGHHMAFPPLPTRDCSWRCSMKAVCPLMDHEPEGAIEMLATNYQQKAEVA